MFGAKQRTKRRSGLGDNGCGKAKYYLDGAMLVPYIQPCPEPLAIDTMTDEFLSVKRDNGRDIESERCVLYMCSFFKQYEGSMSMLESYSHGEVNLDSVSNVSKWIFSHGSEKDTDHAILIDGDVGADVDIIQAEYPGDDYPVETKKEPISYHELALSDQDKIEFDVDIGCDNEIIEQEEQVSSDTHVDDVEDETEMWVPLIKSNHHLTEGLTVVKGCCISIDLSIDDISEMPILVYPFGDGEDKTYMYPFEEDITMKFTLGGVEGEATCKLVEEDRHLCIDMLFLDGNELRPPIQGQTDFKFVYPDY